MKRNPYLLLFILLIVLTFILGFRSGQKTEKTNEAIDYVLSITPTPKPPTPTPIKYKQSKSKKWGIDFTYPSNLTIKESTNTPEVKFELNNE
jgi:hypothetical protein